MAVLPTKAHNCMPHVLSSTEPATPAWLTSVLREAGQLPQGEVVALAPLANAAFNSAALHLEATYSADAPAEAPRCLFLKRNLDQQWAIKAGAREVAFYALAAPYREHLPMLVPCYAAAVDAVSGHSFCLLLDVTHTHTAPVTREQLLAWKGVPSEAQLHQIVDAIAGFHAFWWEHPSLGQNATELSDWYQDQAGYGSFVGRARTDWAAFIAAEGAWFPADLRALYERTLERFPALWEGYLAQRIPTRRNLTLTHGDCYLSQFLCPIVPAGGQTYLIDFQGPATDLCTIDLVFLFATFWTSAQRQEGEREQRLLRCYHQALQARGVQAYSWDDLMADYRLALIFMLSYPIWDQTNGSRKSYWWPKLQCLTAAFQDWDCVALLDYAG